MLKVKHIVAIGAIACSSVFLSIVPAYDYHKGYLIVSDRVLAQDISDQDIDKYASAILRIEMLRRQTYDRITKIIGQTPPEVVCNQPDSFSNLPSNAQKIVKDFCNDSKNIVANSGLDVTRFNTITSRAQSDSDLQKRIQNALTEVKP